MQLVRKSKEPSFHPLKEDGYDICLAYWLDTHHFNRNDLDEWLSEWFLDHCDSAAYLDRQATEIAEATDAMIHSLRSHHQWAIKKKYGIATVWNFPSLDYITTTQEAEIELRKKLKNNSFTRLFF